MEWSGPKVEGGYYWQSLINAAKAYKIDLDKPVKELSKDQLRVILYGTGDRQISMTYQSGNGNEFKFTRAFEGVITNLERRYRETDSQVVRDIQSRMGLQVDGIIGSIYSLPETAMGQLNEALDAQAEAFKRVGIVRVDDGADLRVCLPTAQCRLHERHEGGRGASRLLLRSGRNRQQNGGRDACRPAALLWKGSARATISRDRPGH